MAANSVAEAQGRSVASRATGKALALPVKNLVALLLVLSGIAMANTTLALQHSWFASPSNADTMASMTMGSLGIALVWSGLRASDVSGSLLGYVGGSLIWMGFFEWTWLSFSMWLGVDPLIIDGVAALPPTMLLVQASTLIFFPLVMLIAANRDTRCRMMLWVRRMFGLNTDNKTAGYGHNAARISATETLFIIWFIYLLTIALWDPRLLGRDETIRLTAVAAIFVWAIYLITQLIRLRDTGTAIRYAIPTGYLLSMPIDALAQLGWYPAVWVRPQEYPLCALFALSVFLFSAVTLMRAPSVRAT